MYMLIAIIVSSVVSFDLSLHSSQRIRAFSLWGATICEPTILAHRCHISPLKRTQTPPSTVCVSPLWHFIPAFIIINISVILRNSLRLRFNDLLPFHRFFPSCYIHCMGFFRFVIFLSFHSPNTMTFLYIFLPDFIDGVFRVEREELHCLSSALPVHHHFVVWDQSVNGLSLMISFERLFYRSSFERFHCILVEKHIVLTVQFYSNLLHRTIL